MINNPKNIPSLDLFRGIAGYGVAICHFYYYLYDLNNFQFYSIFFVEFFFVLSGFVLFPQLHRVYNNTKNIRIFYFRRWFRTIPPYLVALVLYSIPFSLFITGCPKRKLPFFSKDFKVISEIGSKDAAVEISSENWLKWMENELSAGSWKVIAEAREGGNVGIYRGTGESEEAINHYNQAISINSNYHQAYYSLGATLLSNGDLENARVALNSAIQLAPDYAKAYGALGTVDQELGEIDSAINNFLQAVTLDAKSFKIYYRLASAYNLQKQYEYAKKSAKDCLNIKRNYAPAYFELGISEKALGNKVAATDAFEKAKKDKNWRKSAQFELDMLSKGF